MVTEEQFEGLEKRVEHIEKGLNEALELLSTAIDKLDTINTGIYGDAKNRHEGLLERVSNLESKLESLEKERLLADIEKEKERVKAEAEKTTKKTTWNTVIDILKWIGLGFLLLKGFIDIDALLKLIM